MIQRQHRCIGGGVNWLYIYVHGRTGLLSLELLKLVHFTIRFKFGINRLTASPDREHVEL